MNESLTRTREFLQGAGALVGASLAGCVSQPDDGDTGTPGTSGPSTGQDVDAGDGPAIVADGEAQAPIVVAADRLDSVDEAVDELNHWIERMTGTTLPVETHEEWDESRPVVAVGSSPLTTDVDDRVAALEEEGAIVRITEDEILLVGQDDPGNDTMTWRGSYYAVRQFLRRLGCSQIWPGELGKVYPETETLAPEIDEWTWETSWPFARARRVYYYDSLMNGRYGPRWESNGFDPISEEALARLREQEHTWLKRNTANHKRPGHRDRVLYGHAFQDFWDEQGEEHPEWFAKPPEALDQEQPEASAGSHNVKLNPTSQEMYDHVFEEWRARYDEDPVVNRALNANPNDGPFFCTREESRELDQGTNSHLSDMDVWEGRSDTDVTNRYVTFYNEFAKRVAEVADDAWVSAYAYQRYTGPPTETEIEHDNIVLGHVKRISRHLGDNQVIDHMEGWEEMGLQKAFWRPNQWNLIPYGPFPYTEKWSQGIAQIADFGMIGADIGGYNYGHWSIKAPMYYILGEKFWDPHADREAILAEFYGAFGPAADDVRAYFDYWEEVQKDWERPEAMLDMNQMRARPLEMPLIYTADRVAEAQSHLDDAASAVEDADEVYQNRVEFLQTGLDHTRRTSQTFLSLFEWELTDDDSALDDAKAQGRELQSVREDLAGSHHMHTYMITWVEQSTFNIWGMLTENDEGGLRNMNNLPEDEYRDLLGLDG